jgi:hypothetical protein
VVIMLDPTPENVLAPVIGARLRRADVQWHVSPGHADTMIRFWLTFDDDATYGFHVGADGEVLDVIPEALGADADLGGYGRLEVRPATPPDPPAAAVGETLTAVVNLHRGLDESAIGAQLRFETVSVAVADWDDELQWASGPFPATMGVVAGS